MAYRSGRGGGEDPARRRASQAAPGRIPFHSPAKPAATPWQGSFESPCHTLQTALTDRERWPRRASSKGMAGIVQNPLPGVENKTPRVGARRPNDARPGWSTRRPPDNTKKGGSRKGSALCVGWKGGAPCGAPAGFTSPRTSLPSRPARAPAAWRRREGPPRAAWRSAHPHARGRRRPP